MAKHMQQKLLIYQIIVAQYIPLRPEILKRSNLNNIHDTRIIQSIEQSMKLNRIWIVSTIAEYYLDKAR